ncbi:MAG: thiamine pyrophosphate-binding protein [Myxococcota bacterium]|nr:thiamine pyrophosphate-binding protein [Myxococcota bacterium]
MSMNVCEQLISILQDVGAEHIFGVTGDALNPFVDGLRRQKQLRWIGVRHEEVAGYAAAAQSLISGGLGVCAGTVGPGALHLLNGLYNAKKEGAAVLAITGQVPRAESGTGFFQEVDLSKVFDDVCVFQHTIDSPEQMPRVAQLAIQEAIANRGVARLEIPADVGPLKVPSSALAHEIFRPQSTTVPSAAHLEQAATVLNKARKPTMLIGSGCRGAREAVLAVAEKMQAPIVHALKGADVMEHEHPLWVGLTGLLGTPAGYHAVEDCDALLMVGTDFPYSVFYPSGKPIVQIDIEPKHLGKRCAVTEGLLGHARPSLEALLPLLKKNTHSGHLHSIQKRFDKWHNRSLKKYSLENKHRPLHPQVVAQAISERAAADAIFAIDVGECTVWSARHLELKRDQRMIGSFNHGSLGAAFPSALGAQALDPSRQVIAICGDGGFGMSLQDFVTAVRYDWPLTVIVFNNSTLGFVKIEMEATGYPEYGAATDLLNPDFAKWAEACGGVGFSVSEPSELVEALDQALTMKRPCIIDVFVDPSELTMPPHIEPAQAWGFSVSKIKEIVHYIGERF